MAVGGNRLQRHILSDNNGVGCDAFPSINSSIGSDEVLSLCAPRARCWCGGDVLPSTMPSIIDDKLLSRCSKSRLVCGGGDALPSIKWL
jgi:hypothetical protein